MKMKRKLVMSTALAATLATGVIPSTSVFAAETEGSTQQVESKTINTQPFGQNNLETAVHAALYGPEVKKIKVFDHEFNVKQVEVVHLDAGKIYVKGQISHHISYRPDDQFYYEFIVQDGKVIDGPKYNIDRGGWTPVAAPLLSILALYNGIPVNPNDLNALGQQIGRIIDGSWEQSAQSIATVVSLSCK